MKVHRGNIEEFNWEGTFSFDTETRDKETKELTLDWAGSEAFMASFHDGEHTLVVENPDYQDLFSRCTKGPTHIIMHNAPYDTAALARHNTNIDYYHWFDTLVASHLLNETRTSNSLKYLARNLLNADTTHITNAYKYKDKFIEYAANDAIWTYQLYKLFKPQLAEQNLETLFYRIEMPFQRVLKHMRITGVKVDMEKRKEIENRLESVLINLNKKFFSIFNMKCHSEYNLSTGELANFYTPINLNSSDQVSDFLYNDLGLPVLEKTDAGAPATHKNCLKKLITAVDDEKIIEALEALIDIRAGQTVKSNFIDKLPEVIEKDGRVRTSFNDTGTTSGRLSSSNPNLQNLPRDSFHGAKVRECYVAPPGKKLVAVDFSGQENRVIAHVCDEDNMARMINKGLDLHLVNARTAFDLPLSDEDINKNSEQYPEIKKKYKKERSRGKVFSYGIPYGAEEYRLETSFNASTEQAKKWLQKYYEEFPGIKKKKEEMKQTLNEQGYITSIYGRRRRPHKAKGRYGEYYPPSEIRSAFNFYIQSPSGDMMRVALIKLYNYMNRNPEMGIEINLTVHDEAVFTVKEEYAEQAAKDAAELFSEVVGPGFKLPMPADSDIGDNYAEAK